MTANGTFQILLYLIILLALVKPLGLYMARVYEGKYSAKSRVLGALERVTYRLCGIDPALEMTWKNYLFALLFLNVLGILAIYGIQRLQLFLPLNPQHFVGVAPDLAFNSAASFATNADWQAYGGESTLSYLTQMLGMTVQNFLSAATGLSVLVVFIRGLIRRETTNLGNFWVDVVRSVVYILLPLSLIFSLLLVSQGVIQNFKPYQAVNLLQSFEYESPRQDAEGNAILNLQGNAATDLKIRTQQILPMGPVASQVAIKQLGTNGGGFFSTNSAHPFENPTPLSNFLEMLAVLLIPAALCYTFGYLVGDTRQGWAILAAMSIILVPLIFTTTIIEQNGNPALTQIGVEQRLQTDLFPGGNMEGKETRFGIVNSTLWASASTATSNGSVNAMLDSFMPIAGMLPLWSLQLGEVVFGGVGTGLTGMLIFIILTVFAAGLMVGRTPEYLGKKIEPFEMKMVSFIVLIMPLIILIFTGIAVVSSVGVSSILNAGAHGFTEVLYAFSSMTQNNGSSFAGLNANTAFYNTYGGLAILIGRFWVFVPTLAIAGSLAAKKAVPLSAGTLPTNTPLFITLLICVVMVVGALTFLPALALGPIVEQLMLQDLYVN
jgi:K+-transporting ATPase ATPase A chain